MENGLFPNMVYYWKLLMFDGSENILGDIEDYEVMGNFRVMPIVLTEPSHGGTNIPLDQKFTWDGPLSVPSYEFLLSTLIICISEAMPMMSPSLESAITCA